MSQESMWHGHSRLCLESRGRLSDTFSRASLSPVSRPGFVRLFIFLLRYGMLHVTCRLVL